MVPIILSELLTSFTWKRGPLLLLRGSGYKNKRLWAYNGEHSLPNPVSISYPRAFTPTVPSLQASAWFILSNLVLALQHLLRRLCRPFSLSFSMPSSCFIFLFSSYHHFPTQCIGLFSVYLLSYSTNQRVYSMVT